eukprot:13349920-Alexandrium_andersonii.AAC.1
MGSQHSPAKAGRAGLGLVKFRHVPAAVGGEEGAGGIRGSPARLPDSMAALPQHLERLAFVSGDQAGAVSSSAEGVLGLQPSPSQPEVFGRLPGGRRLAQRGLGGSPGLRSLALPDGEPGRGLGGAQPSAVTAMAHQPGGGGTV